MGFEDRDWNRKQAPRRGGRWSVNGWIIGLCVAIFVLDGFLGLARTGILIGRCDLDGVAIPATEVRRYEPFGEPLSLAQANREFPPAFAEAAVRAAGKVGALDWAGSARVQVLSRDGQPAGFAYFIPSSPLKTWLHFSTSTALFGDSGEGAIFPQLWRFVGFQFLHANLTHLIFNMMGLWFFGPVVERYLGGKRYAAFYLLCGICGAAMYLLLNFLGSKVMLPGQSVPFLLPNAPTTPLVGASAGVFGVIMAAAFLAPMAEVLVFMIIPMPLRNLAYTLVAVALLTLFFGGDNAGGEAAHLGGAIAGFWLIRHPHTLHALFDWMGTFDPTSRSRRVRSARRRGMDTAEIDRILDKIQREGLHSLSQAERQALREASRR
ncbi:MAG: rhomboid family intramembrane serine protease [Phycisphaerales bacterium]|jgi:membrane associated rhomboid family serine protease